MKYVLYDKNAKVYAGLDRVAKITMEETTDTAVIFDHRDNMPMKVKFYNMVTGMSFESIEV